DWSQTWTYFDGEWREGNLPLWGVRTHSIWLGSSVFDGARAFEGVAPDLDLHCARVNASAKTMFLKPTVTVEQWIGLVREGMARFPENTTLYIRPMYCAERPGPQALPPDPESTRWCLTLYDAPMRKPEGFSITLSPFKRPTLDTAPVDAKAGCLYPNNARAMFEAKARGFDNCIVCDFLGNVAELANSNVFMAKDGVVITPIPNGTFLNGITRQRVIKLLRADGIAVVESTLRYRDFENADEIFATGNASKVLPVTRIDERSLQPGPLYRRARELYWAYAHG
ncbi:MAG TPA: branched-chain amino acid aminotransferase, partial [Burkholderiales bacterium]|nr:branched-chain amino acid aminotransferase [Burkholderiales bacterium]